MELIELPPEIFGLQKVQNNIPNYWFFESLTT